MNTPAPPAETDPSSMLAQERQLLEATIQAMGQGLMVIGPDQRVRLFNDQACQMLDLPREFLATRPLLSEVVAYQTQRGDFGKDFSQVQTDAARAYVGSLATQVNRMPVRYTRVTTDGRHIEIQTHPMPSGDVVRTYSDITPYEEAKKKAEEASRAKSQFLSNMSHEIRTPMNGILGMAHMLLEPDLTEQERQDYVRTILSSGQTLLALLNDILDLSKVEAGMLQLEAATFDAQVLLRDTQALFAGSAKNKQLELCCAWHGTAGQAYRADAHRLRQMLANLVGNAIKFTAQGSVHIEATELTREGTDATLEFAVRDTGTGIPADKLPRLFKPFSQADESTTRHFGGSGLGLSIVSTLAQAMGGEAGVDSTIGQGSRFWFRIRAEVAVDNAPQADTHASPALHAQPTDTPQTLAPAPALTGRVLVVDDNLTNCKVIQALLTKLGLRVNVVHNGQEAVDAITQGPPECRPDLVFMDVSMPVMDGYEATRLIRQWEAAQQVNATPVIALTANAFEDNRQRCAEAGMNDFLTKPIAVPALKAVLGTWLPGTTS
ncbi:MAG TPA: ATP-binding protein [Burkholderiaceae bacterium]|nr:ATP-binding protein [Burkholderiaceae bacterium]